MFETEALPGQLTKWSVHVSACALPSFIIALVIGINTSEAIAGMLAGIATFIIVFALLTSTSFYQRRREGLLGKSLRAGTRIRVFISLLSLPLLAGFFLQWEALIQIIPDFWCGYLAAMIVEKFGGLFSLGIDQAPFTTAYLITVIEGIIISATLALLCLLALWPISVRAAPNPDARIS